MHLRVLIVLVVMFPFGAHAQTEQVLRDQINALLNRIKTLQQQIETPAPESVAQSASTCPSLSRALSVGSRGDDVRQLQVFLKAQGVFGEEATGYFGKLTEAGVQVFQKAQGLVTDGSAATTGYGSVGPKTRSRIAYVCVSGPVTQAPQCSPGPLRPSSSNCPGTWEQLTNEGCHVGWRCSVTSFGNKAPVVSNIEGPRTLQINSFGTWRINAIDPEQTTLSYNVTWGDEGIEEILNAIAGLGGTYAASPTITHAYAKPGTFTVNVTVKDSDSKMTSATFSVVVQAGASAEPVFSIPVAVGTTSLSASCVTPWGEQIVRHLESAEWEPFFTNGLFFGGTSTPTTRCSNGTWQKCDAAGGVCQTYSAPTSTQSVGTYPSYGSVIGSPCGAKGGTKMVTVSIGTQLCQKLSCRTTTELETLKLTCSDNGWSDFIK